MARIAGLDVARIVKAALAIADRDGLDKLTMRRLSRELGVTPMAPYHHVSGKDELLDLVIDESIGQIPVDTSGDDPEAAIVDWFQRLHAMLVEHPSLAQAAAGRRIVGPQARQVGATLSGMAEEICHDPNIAAEVVVASFWLTLGGGLHRASRHPGGDGAGILGPGAAEHRVDPDPAVERVLTAAGKDDQFRRSLTRLVRSYLTS